MLSVYLRKEALNDRGIIKEKAQAKVFLLNKALRDAGALPPEASLTEQDLARTSGKKPFLPGFLQIRFNFSHSGEYLALAVSDKEVGLDLQERKMRQTDPLKIAGRFFTQDEYRSLLSCQSQEETASLFCLLWTIKEAYLKYLGCGLAGRMDSFRPDPLPAFAEDTGKTVPETETECNGLFRAGAFSRSQLPHTGPCTGHRICFIPLDHPGRILQLDSLFQSEEGSKENGSLLSVPLHSGRLPFHTAQYALLPGPAGYAMTVCAGQLPEEIRICCLDF